MTEETDTRIGRKSSSTMGSDGVPEESRIDPDVATDDDVSSVGSTPRTLSRNPSFSGSNSYHEDWEVFPPLDKLSVFDLLDNFSLPQKLEKWQKAINSQKDKVKQQRERLKSTSVNAKHRVVDEWKKHAPTAEERLEKYRQRMNDGVERLGRQWNMTTTVTAREKISFIAGVVNVFVSGYLIGAFPEYFYIWYTVQLAFFMPVRYLRYHKKGYHYFLADLCYFVNLLAVLCIWVFPSSKRLFISTYCLAFGNNAVAIPLWRNSMVFHSMDKVVSVFIHIMPPAALHCLTHLTAVETLKERFPAIYDIKFSDPSSPEHYSLGEMVVWATVPYAIWQLTYHLFITVRRKDKIAAGRPTSFTWLRQSWGKTWLGKIVLSLPEPLQVPAYMLIQYMYAIVAMVPCPIWFWSKSGSSLFLFGVFVWSVYNGSTFYIDVFGKRFQKELEQLKKDVARWQSSPESTTSPGLAPSSAPAEIDKAGLDSIPPLDSSTTATGVNGDGKETSAQASNGQTDSGLRERK